MLDAIRETFRHPLVERERRRWAKRLASWPKAALALAGAGFAFQAAVLASRAAGWASTPLPPAGLEAASRAMAAGALAAAALAPVALASAWLTPWLRSAEFEELLVTSASRSGIARAVWALAWLRCAAWTGGAQLFAASFAFILFDAASAAKLAGAQAILASLLLPALGLSAAMATRVAMERRAFGAVLWRTLVWQLALFPALGLLAAGVFAMGAMVIVAPLLVVAAHLLSVLGGPGAISILAVAILALAAVFASTVAAFVASLHIARAEAWCVPRDWLESSYRWGRGAAPNRDA